MLHFCIIGIICELLQRLYLRRFFVFLFNIIRCLTRYTLLVIIWYVSVSRTYCIYSQGCVLLCSLFFFLVLSMPSIIYSSWSENPRELWCRYSKEIPDAYERLLLDAIEGERRLFIRSDELDAAWELFTPLLKELEEKKIAPELYPYGSRGPVGAHYLAAKYNVRWGDLGSDYYRGWERERDFHGVKLQNYCMYQVYMGIRFWRCREFCDGNLKIHWHRGDG